MDNKYTVTEMLNWSVSKLMNDFVPTIITFDELLRIRATINNQESRILRLEERLNEKG